MAKPKQRMIEIESLTMEAYGLEKQKEVTARRVLEKPVEPTIGEFWVDKDTGHAYVYYDDPAKGGSSWIQVGGSAR